jgi:hypothetical protein
MYIVASTWKFGSAATAREAVKRMRAGLAPLIGAQPGLHAWYLTITGTEEALTISIWTAQDDYEQAQPHLAAWVQEHVGDLDARVQQRRRGNVAAQAGS